MKRKAASLIVAGILTLVIIQTTAVADKTTTGFEETTFFERVTIIEYDDSSLEDDYIYLAAIPTSVYYVDGQPIVSSLIFDQKSKNEKYLLQDIAECWGSNTEIVCIGDVNSRVLKDFQRINQPKEIITLTCQEDTIFGWAGEIASSLKKGANIAVLAPIGLDTDNYVEYVQAASNGAIIASLLNCPLLYIEDSLPSATLNALLDLGINEVILVRPQDFSTYNIIDELNSNGIVVTDELSDITEMIQYIRDIKDTNYLTLIYNNEEDREEPYVVSIPNSRANNLPVISKLFNKFLERPFIRFLRDSFSSDFNLGNVYGHTATLDLNKEKISNNNIEVAAGPSGEIDEMPFGPAAFIGAFHAGPVLTFPTENEHSQLADEYAEYIGNQIYQKWKDKDYKDSPAFEDMERISTEFYAWLSDLDIDAPSRENVIIVGHIAEIDPSLDRAIFGKAIAGRIGTGEAPDASYIINRNILYPELIEVNDGNDVLMSFIAYGHGCEFVDNNGDTQIVMESEDVPNFYKNAGCNVKYHTNFLRTTLALRSGVRFWVNSGHSFYGTKPVMGHGTIAVWKGFDKWRGFNPDGNPQNPNPINGSIGNPYDPKLTMGLPSELFLLITGNLHSAAMYWLLCYMAGCQTPVDWQKSGASVVIADYTGVSFEGGGWLDTRLNEEIAKGETYGDALLTALRETGSIYSEGKEGLSKDESLQYIIYGDPSLRLILD